MDLPQLEKKSLTALANVLRNASDAQSWAQALLDEVPSVHLFAFRSLRRLGQDSRSLAAPLRHALGEFWQKQSPSDAEIGNEETSQQRRAQEEMLVRAVELLLEVDFEGALELCREQVKVYAPIEQEQQRQYKEQQRRNEVARQAIQDALGEALTIPEWLKGGKPSLFQMANWVDREAYTQAYNRPDIQELFKPIGEDVWEWRRKNWNPLQTFRGAFGALSQGKKDPQKATLEEVRGWLRGYLLARLEEDGEESASIASAFLQILAHVDHSYVFQESPGLLRRSRPWIDSLPEGHPSHHLWQALSWWFFYGFYGYSRNVRFDWNPQDALDLFDVLETNTDEPSEFNRLLEEARVAYRHNLPEQRAAREALHQQTPTRALAINETSEWGEAYAPLHRLPEESARDFLKRAKMEELASQEIHRVALESNPGASEIHQHFHKLQYEWSKLFLETVASWNEDDKREALLDCCREGERDINQLGDWWKNQALLQPLLPSWVKGRMEAFNLCSA